MDFWEVAPNKKLFSLPVAHGFEAYKSIRDLNLRTTLLKLERCTALLWTLLLSLYMGASISAYISMKQNNVFPSSFSYSASFYFLWAGLLYQILQRRGCFLWFKKKVRVRCWLSINCILSFSNLRFHAQYSALWMQAWLRSCSFPSSLPILRRK